MGWSAGRLALYARRRELNPPRRNVACLKHLSSPGPPPQERKRFPRPGPVRGVISTAWRYLRSRDLDTRPARGLVRPGRGRSSSLPRALCPNRPASLRTSPTTCTSTRSTAPRRRPSRVRTNIRNLRSLSYTPDRRPPLLAHGNSSDYDATPIVPADSAKEAQHRSSASTPFKSPPQDTGQSVDHG